MTTGASPDAHEAVRVCDSIARHGSALAAAAEKKGALSLRRCRPGWPNEHAHACVRPVHA